MNTKPDKLAPLVLLVEGHDEKSFFTKLLHYLNVPDDRFHIWNAGGVTNIASKIDAIAQLNNLNPVVRRLGIIRDADADRANAFKSVANALKKYRLPYPHDVGVLSAPDANGLCTAAFIMPGDAEGTMLESLCLKYIQDHRPERWTCIEQLLACAELTHNRKEKAKLQIALAYEEKSPHHIARA